MRLAASLLAGALAASSVTAHAGSSPAPRLFVDGGLTAPVAPSRYSPGYGLGAGVEIAASRPASFIAQAEVHTVLEGRETTGGPIIALGALGSTAGDGLAQSRLTLVSTLLGVRVHTAGSIVRSYVDLGAGVRIGPGAASLRPVGSPGPGVQSIRETGLIGVLRTGLTLAPAGRAGLFADVGYEFATKNPLREGLIPLRIGIALP